MRACNMLLWTWLFKLIPAASSTLIYKLIFYIRSSIIIFFWVINSTGSDSIWVFNYSILTKWAAEIYTSNFEDNSPSIFYNIV